MQVTRSVLTAWILAAAGILALVAMAALPFFVNLNEPPNILLFFGRFHPLLVHFPIGIFFVILLLEVMTLIPRFRKYHLEMTPILGLGVFSALVAVGAGFLLSLEGGYDEGLLFWHKWLGFGVALGAILALIFWIHSRNLFKRDLFRRLYALTLGVTLAMVMGAGHYGGTMSHGADYLTHHMPGFLKRVVHLVADEDEGMGIANITDIGEAVVYRDLVQPVLEERCVTCHNQNKRKGELELDSPEGLLEGGARGRIVVAGDPDASEIYQRVTLSPNDERHMPPAGQEPLTVAQTEMIRWWIAEGASLDLKVADAQTRPASIQTILNRLAPAGGSSKTGIFALEVPPPDEESLKALAATGISAEPLARDQAFLRIQIPGDGSGFTDEDLAKLEPLAPQIAWLDLAGTAITDRGLASVARMKHLMHLHLENTGISGEGLKELKDLKYLEYLNLYGTEVTDADISALAEIKSLEALYLWQTEVTAEGAERLQEQVPGVRIDLGVDEKEFLQTEQDQPQESAPTS